MYNGLFYITGVNEWYMEGEVIHIIFIAIIFIPSYGYFLYLIRLVSTQFLILVFKANKKCFKIITCGLVKENDFYMTHIATELEKAMKNGGEKEVNSGSDTALEK